MGKIVEFRQTRSKTQRHSDPLPPQGAQILFFTGVRYEPHPEPETPLKEGLKRKRSPRPRSPAKRSRRA